jgi:hypothetical protein
MASPEITGRAPLGASSTIAEFCAVERISRAKYYQLRQKGLGPDETRVDGIIRITPESHARWRRRHTKRASVQKPMEAAAKKTAEDTA